MPMHLSCYLSVGYKSAIRLLLYICDKSSPLTQNEPPNGTNIGRAEIRTNNANPPILMNRSLLLTLLSPAALAAEERNDTLVPRPNVILIYADDMGYGDLGCYGGKVQTPHVDRLAAMGTRFTHAHATAATSTPSRYAMLTGEYAWRRPGTDVAAGDAAMIIRSEDYTMADLFRHAGYATAAIGKWHLGLGHETGGQDWNAPLAAYPGDLGFDYSYIMAATADRVPCVFIENGRVVNYDPSAPIEVSYRQPFAGEPLGSTHPQLLYNQRSSHGHDMAIVNGIGRIGYMKGGGKALWKDEDIADSIASRAERFIRSQADKPFFLYLATNDIHVPRFPHPRFRGQTGMGVRGDAIAQFDWTVGRILQTLDELGLTENTLILLSSDNGPVVDDGYDDQAEEFLGNHRPAGRLRGNKYSAYEGGTRVPAIVCWPGHVPAGQTSTALVSQIDWFGSLASLLQARIPRQAAPDSRNHLSTWLGRDMKHRSWVVEQAANHTLSIRTAEWKYIEPHEGPKMIPWGPKIETGNSPTPQLYDLRTDEQERNNVADKHPDVVRQMQEIRQQITDRTTGTILSE